jgi:hypothetical protein
MKEPFSKSEFLVYETAISLLRTAIQDPAGQTHDSTIQAIFHLSFEAPTDQPGSQERRPRQSAYSTWNLLHIGSSLSLTEAHMSGLRAVIGAKGGIWNIETSQLRLTVSL